MFCYASYCNENVDNLHIAVVNSNGHIYEFDKYGFSIDKQRTNNWPDCLSMNIFKYFQTEKFNYEQKQIWDNALKQISLTYKNKQYSANDNNCLDFVIKFLRIFATNHQNFDQRALESKQKFCELILAQRGNVAVQYLSLHNKLQCGIQIIDKSDNKH